MSLLEQDTIKRWQRDETTPQIELEEGSKEYEVEAIRDSKVYTKKGDHGQLPRLYYLISWEGYTKEENT